MMNKVFDLTFHKSADNRRFLDLCSVIERKIPDLHLHQQLVDVDGSVIRIYKLDGKLIKVTNDYDIDAVYVESELNLSSVF